MPPPAAPTVDDAVVAALVDDVALWADVVGQDEAVGALRAAARQPVHAYLFLGPQGSGRHAAARAFAAAILGVDALGRGQDPARDIDLARSGRHPDVHLFAPEGASISVDDAEEITRQASRAPTEAAHKVLVLDEFHKVQQAGPALLKTIEEPSASTIFVILAEEVPAELVPIASRAVRIDFGAVPVAAIEAALVGEGVDAAVAADAAQAAAGDLDRARLLVTDPDLAARRDAWLAIPSQLDGTGATAARLVDDVVARIDEAQGPLDAAQATEVAELVERIELYGLPRRELKDLETRHKRQVRRYRTAEVRFGLGLLAAAYRDRLVTDPDPVPVRDALAAIQTAAEALPRNPAELLLLQALVAGLPPG